MRVVLLVFVVLLVAPSSAGAIEMVNPDGTRAEPYQTWANAARVPVVDGSVLIGSTIANCGPQPGPIDGCAWTDRIEMRWHCGALRSLTNRRKCRVVYWHEMGHLYLTTLTPAQMNEAASIVGQPLGGATLIGHGDEVLEVVADSYALCQLRKASVSAMFTRGAPDVNRALCRWLLRTKSAPSQ